MEQVRAARRSASHGSMNRRYAADTGFSPQMATSNPFARRPLRSVNENTCLLPFPGPLESMLKTTTETGDIGVFSIKPSRSTSNFHQPLYAQSNSGDKNWQRLPRGNVLDAPTFRDDGSRTLRSRDPASENTSVYGSASHRSASSTFSQSLDDLAQRTYSMTSCSSRPISNKKSNGTLQSQSSGTPQQRPRSPFPYPARLRRPGVWPSSPAWTDNGAVDYSRMMQIDRLPHRTVRDLRKPAYPHDEYRATHGPSRLDGNRSVSLPSSSSPAGAKVSSGQISNGPMTRGSKYRDRLDSGNSDNGLTSSGSASINGMRRPSYPRRVQNHHSRTQSGGVVFYDYSEQFDQVPLAVKPSSPPLAPIPTRGPSLHRHMLLDDRYTIRFRDTDTQNYDQVLRVSSPLESDPKQEPPNNQQNHLLPTKPLLDGSPERFPDAPMYPQTNGCSEDTEQGPPQQGIWPSDKSNPPSSTTSGLGCAQPLLEKCPRDRHFLKEVNNDLWADRDNTGREPPEPVSLERYNLAYKKFLQSSTLPETRSISQPGGIHRSISLSCETQEPTSYTFSGYLRRSQSHSVESDHSTPPSPVQFPEHNDEQTSAAHHTCSDNVSVHHHGQRAGTAQESVNNRSSPTHHAETSFLLLSTSKGCGGHERGDSNDFNASGIYRRLHGFPKPSNNASPGSAEGDDSSENENALPIFAPQPVSPTRRLKLQNSVPQLMKTLPLLPSPRGSTSSSSELVADELDLTTSASSRSHGDGSPAFQEHPHDGRVPKSSNGRLRLKIPGHGIPRAGKVPIPLGQVMPSKSSTLRHQGLSGDTQEDENTQGPVSTSKSSQRILKDGVTALGGCVDKVGSPSSPPPRTSVLRHATTETEDVFIGEPSSPRVTIHSASLASTSDLRSTFSDGPAGSHKPPRGLRKRVSDLRARLAESRLKSTDYRESPGKQIVSDGVVTPFPPAHPPVIGEEDETHEKNPPTGNLGHTLAVPRGLKGRMSRWMITVRESVMAACTGSRKRG